MGRNRDGISLQLAALTGRKGYLRAGLVARTFGRGIFSNPRNVKCHRPWCPRQDSNLRTRLRRPVLYPLSYEGGPTQHTLAPAA